MYDIYQIYIINETIIITNNLVLVLVVQQCKLVRSMPHSYYMIIRGQVVIVFLVIN
jgi:hypothetical protein